MRLKHTVLYTMGLVFAISLVSGCEDDSDSSAKAAREKTAAVLATLEGHISSEKLTEAQQTIRSVLSNRGEGRDPALLAEGNLSLFRVRTEAIELEKLTIPVFRQIRTAQENTRRVSQIQLQRERIEQLIQDGDNEIQELTTVLEKGTEVIPGLKSQLAAQQSKQADLTDRRAQWMQKAQAAEQQLQSLQARADEALQQARLTSDTQKAGLEKAGYDLLLQKKEFYIKKQEALDMAAELSSRIDLVRPIVEKLTGDIGKTQQKISDLKQSAQLRQLRQLQQDLNLDESREQQALKEQVQTLEKQADAYRSGWRNLIDKTQKILDSYDQIRSGELGPIIQFKKGQVNALLGSIQASRLYFESELGLALEGFSKTADQETARIIQRAMVVVAEDDMITQATGYFDKADEAFAAALSSGSSLGKAFGADVTKSRLLAMDEKMSLADRLDRFELAESTQTRLDELKQEAVEKYGPTFTLSETSRLLDKGLDYSPQIPFDSRLYFESIKSSLTAWKSMRGQAQEQRARQTLEEIKRFESQADETLLELLAPEKRAIETAIEQGFPEQAAGGTSSQPAEPNGF